MLVRFVGLALCFLLLASPALAASVTLKWEKAPLATSYEIEQSGSPVQGPWTVAAAPLASGACPAAGTSCAHTLTNVSETGVVYFRITAVNAAGKTPRSDAGAWFCFSCKPPDPASGAGIQ